PWGLEGADIAANVSSEPSVKQNAANLALTYGFCLFLTGNVRQATEIFKQNVRTREKIHDTRGEGAALCYLAQATEHLGNLDEASQLFRRALAIDQREQHRHGESVVLNCLGRISRQQGRVDEAQAFFEQSIAIHRELGNIHGEASALTNLGQLA